MMRITNDTKDWVYITDLLCWYYGLTVHQVRDREWTEEEIKKAEKYAEETHIDVLGYATRYGLL